MIFIFIPSKWVNTLSSEHSYIFLPWQFSWISVKVVLWLSDAWISYSAVIVMNFTTIWDQTFYNPVFHLSCNDRPTSPSDCMSSLRLSVTWQKYCWHYSGLHYHTGVLFSLVNNSKDRNRFHFSLSYYSPSETLIHKEN